MSTNIHNSLFASWAPICQIREFIGLTLIYFNNLKAEKLLKWMKALGKCLKICSSITIFSTITLSQDWVCWWQLGENHNEWHLDEISSGTLLVRKENEFSFGSAVLTTVRKIWLTMRKKEINLLALLVTV